MKSAETVRGGSDVQSAARIALGICGRGALYTTREWSANNCDDMLASLRTTYLVISDRLTIVQSSG
jgi:hypothetical protein